uniref:Uncharacterized protein n=1 Tax=Arundo donax TaxID=35708 RepID=A0A0A9A9R7_ARUDO
MHKMYVTSIASPYLNRARSKQHKSSLLSIVSPYLSAIFRSIILDGTSTLHLFSVISPLSTGCNLRVCRTAHHI